MVNRKSSLFIAAIVTLVSFVAITWMSCNKNEGSFQRCEGVVCENGGYCSVDTTTRKPKCNCPTGFTGTNCGTAIISKYLGAWKMRQIIVGSDSPSHLHDTTYYSVILKKSATPTTFFIDNFSNNRYYNEIVCTLDNNNSYIFGIDTISAYHMLFDNYKLTYGYGSMTYGDSFIIADFGVRHLTTTANWVHDTVNIRLSERTSTN